MEFLLNVLLGASIPVSIILRIISCTMLLFFCIPLQIKEAGVKNGLKVLRYQLLSFGVILFLTNLFSLGFLYLALSVPQKLPNATLQIGNAVAFLLLAIIGHQIYNKQYTDESKEIHEKIARIEDKRAKRG